jgi:transposase, IS5 family
MKQIDSFFRSRLDQMIDLRHPLTVLASHMPIRLMVSLLYLKHAFNDSNEGVVERWSETPAWQYFTGMDYFEHRLPCGANLIGKIRKLITDREKGDEEMLSQTNAVALNQKVISR